MREVPRPPTPSIALVAVPGAGDHPPGAAARSVADLLLRLDSGGRSRYSLFVEHAVRIPTAPARVNPRSAPNVAPDLRWSIFAEQHAFLRTQLQYGGAAARDREEDSPDHQLMRAQLAAYRSTGAPYESVLLEGERLTTSADAGGREAEARVHVYEVRWSDLSRPSGGRRLLSELYRLSLHVADLGRTALDHARLEYSSSALWRAYGTAHTWAVRALALFVPALLFAMLATLGAAVLPQLVSPGSLPGAQSVLAGWLVTVGGLAAILFRAYERVRPGALAVGGGAYAIAVAAVAAVALRARLADELFEETTRILEVEAVLAVGLWGTVYVAGAVAGVLALVACARTTGAAARRAWRTARTAAVTLAVATTTVAVGTFVFQAAAFRAAAALPPDRSYEALLPAFRAADASYAHFLERVLETTAGAGVPLLTLLVTALAVIVALAIAPALLEEARPSRTAHGFEHRANGTPPPPRDAPVDTDDLWEAWERLRREGNASQRLGRSVARGFRLAGVAAVLLYVAVFVLAPLASVLAWVTGARALAALQASGSTIIVAIGGALVVGATTLVVLRRRFGPLARSVGPALDLLLEIDAYLRTRPRESTPRARIAERYVSLLRYLCQWRDGHGRPYDAILVVAHSQGVAITADLLNFVQREEDPDLEPLRRPLANAAPDGAGRRLFLLTMGSPLRQLYSEWFPHLFSWVRGETGDGVSRALPAVPREPWMLLPRLEDGHRVSAPAIPEGAAPDPYAMGVTRWVNAYRSGDYVGRAQWRHAADGCDWVYRPAPADAATRFISDVPPVTYVSEDAHRSRRELCLGGGAHTHYWDASAKGIAVELDLLVTEATRLAARVVKDTGAPAEGMES